MTSTSHEPVSGENQSAVNAKSHQERPLVPSVTTAVAAVAALACIFALGIAGILFYGKDHILSSALPEVGAMIEMREALSYDNLKAPCAAELAQLCGAARTPAEHSACLKKNRDSVSPACEVAIRNQFGGKPLQEPMLYRNVLLPVGTWFFYDDRGEILGAITSGPTRSRGIEYKAGQIRFNQTGISVGDLAHDQTYKGIKYAAKDIGLFLYDDDQVETAILAEDTSIQGRTYKGGTQIHFHPSGTVSMGELANTGELVTYNADGSVDSISRPEPPAAPLVLVESSATKPICRPGDAPTDQCLPQRFANLPPDPGARGRQTLKGIDSDSDGVRDDAQRFIVLNWGHSERAVRALSSIARNVQTNIELGSTLDRDAAYEIAKSQGKSISCFSRSVDQKITFSNALEKVVSQVANTPERHRRYREFDGLLSGRVFMLDEGTIQELCGYDPTVLPN